MRTIAIGAIPSVDLSAIVSWMNSNNRIAITLEARTLSLGYAVSERLPSDPWLLNPDMIGVVRRSVERRFSTVLEDVYADIASEPGLETWGDAHCHYLDPLDKPDFMEYLVRQFGHCAFVSITDDLEVCAAKLVERGWAASTMEAADVVARHQASSELIRQTHPDRAFCFDLTSECGWIEEAGRLGRWMEIGTDRVHALRSAFLSRIADQPTSKSSAEYSAAVNSRLSHWRHQLKVVFSPPTSPHT